MLIDMFTKMDGTAAVNVSEPSEGDLERVVNAYRQCRDERDRYKAALEFYAHKAWQDDGMHGNGYQNWMSDVGARARAALKANDGQKE